MQVARELTATWHVKASHSTSFQDLQHHSAPITSSYTCITGEGKWLLPGSTAQWMAGIRDKMDV